MLVGYEYGTAATVAKTTSFFRFTRIQPVNRDVFISGADLLQPFQDGPQDKEEIIQASSPESRGTVTHLCPFPWKNYHFFFLALRKNTGQNVSKGN